MDSISVIANILIIHYVLNKSLALLDSTADCGFINMQSLMNTVVAFKFRKSRENTKKVRSRCISNFPLLSFQNEFVFTENQSDLVLFGTSIVVNVGLSQCLHVKYLGMTLALRENSALNEISVMYVRACVSYFLNPFLSYVSTEVWNSSSRVQILNTFTCYHFAHKVRIPLITLSKKRKFWLINNFSFKR